MLLVTKLARHFEAFRRSRQTILGIQNSCHSAMSMHGTLGFGCLYFGCYYLSTKMPPTKLSQSCCWWQI